MNFYATESETTTIFYKCNYKGESSRNIIIWRWDVKYAGCKVSQFYSLPLLAHESFQLAPKPFLISRIDYNTSVIWISQKKFTCSSGKLKTEFTGPKPKSTSPRLSNTTFFACWICHNPQRPVQWFHFSCIGITRQPTGHWYCDECQLKVGQE